MVANWATAPTPLPLPARLSLVSEAPGLSVRFEGSTLWVQAGPVACIPASARRFAGHIPILFPANKCGIEVMRLGARTNVCNRPLNRRAVV